MFIVPASLATTLGTKYLLNKHGLSTTSVPGTVLGAETQNPILCGLQRHTDRRHGRAAMITAEVG